MLLAALVSLLVTLVLCCRGRAWLGLVGGQTVFLVWMSIVPMNGFAYWPLVGLTLIGACATGIPDLRRKLITGLAMRALAPMFPSMSDTERVALKAGTVWFEAELFRGAPDWKQLLDFQTPDLTAKESSFLENEVSTVCRMTDPARVDDLGDLPPEVWAYLKANKFLGLIIPEEYGGLGFKARAISEIITRCSSHNVTLAVTIMLPSSLGPAELLLHYGTPEQRKTWLPRLADGSEVPAFALTEPNAGSDAGGLTSRGVLEMGDWKGERVMGLRLTWNKRYITLAPVATILGLAVQVEDPDALLGDERHRGITCVLVPTHLHGVEVGRRHDPLGVKFINGPTTGQDVFVPLDHVIGGESGIGRGWRMLMDCLSAGRALSLPGLAAGGTQTTSRVVSAYGELRQQFGMSIARFEGVEEALARIHGNTWWIDAARRLTAGAVASGESPSVVSAIMKAWATEAMRDVVNDGMDVMAGAGICRGPRNVLAGFYQALPIGITVEGANILTRTLIVFGQGALRCHPFAFDEMEAARTGDLVTFDRCFSGHVGHIVSTGARSLVNNMTGGLLIHTPLDGRAGRSLQRLTRASAAFALVAEGAMATLGGDLKRRERLTGRLADALAGLYFGSACVKRWVDADRNEAERPLFEYGVGRALHDVETALDSVLRNLPNRPAAWLLRALALPFGVRAKPAKDELLERVVRAVRVPEVRDELTASVFLPGPDQLGLGTLESALKAVQAAIPAQEKLTKARREGRLHLQGDESNLDAGLRLGVLDQSEAQLVRTADSARQDAIEVDAYDAQSYRARCGA
jgi:acyl-CoA dehydrogenase